MARKKGTLNISSNIEPNAAAPLDARTVVATMEELASAETFPFPYAGLTVFVRAENESYVFTGGDITDTANWKRVGISEELEAELKANTAAIETLNGAGEGSVTKAVADGIAEVVASAPEDFDTLKEIADYIEADKTGAAQMNNAISENARNISQAQTDIAANAADITQAKQDISDLSVRFVDNVMSILSRVGYRNKFLGNEFTDAQKAAIAAGDFSDLWNGDYWIINGIYWRIWDNTGWYMNKGDTPFTKPHLVIMPDECLVKLKGINATDVTTGGYNDTRYRSTDRATCRTIIANAFGADHIGSHRELISNAIANGHASGWAWVDADVELPSEACIYGTTVWGDGYGQGYNTGIFYARLALSGLNPSSIVAKKPDGTTENYWLRDVVSAVWFANVSGYGVATDNGAAGAFVGFRPLFLLI